MLAACHHVPRPFVCATLLLGVAWCVGCGGQAGLPDDAGTQPDTNAAGVPGQESAEPASPLASSQGDVALEVADAARLQELLEQNRGKVVLVDFWATWCVPCKKNFPKVVGYARQHGPDAVTLISVSMDDASAHAEAERFLRSIDAVGTHLRSQWGVGSESAEQFGFSGEVPFYRLYDRSGALRYCFSANADADEGIESLEQVEPRLKALLAESA